VGAFGATFDSGDTMTFRATFRAIIGARFFYQLNVPARYDFSVENLALFPSSSSGVICIVRHIFSPVFWSRFSKNFRICCHLVQFSIMSSFLVF
jgi:hypothetical protein